MFQPPVESRRLRGGLLSNIEVIGDFILAGEQLYTFKSIQEELNVDVVSKPKNRGEERTYQVRIRPVGVVQGPQLFYCFNQLIKKVLSIFLLLLITNSFYSS